VTIPDMSMPTRLAPPLDNAEIERLILVAGTRDGTVWATVDDLGAQRVSDVLVNEVEFRADVPVIDLVDTPVQVQLDTVHGGQRFSYVFDAVHGQPLLAYPGASEHAAMVIEYQLVDLVNELFGPAAHPRAGRRRTVPRFEAAAARRPDVRIVTMTRAGHQAITAVLSGIDKPADLDALAPRYYSDKWGGLHWFTPHYTHHLSHLRDQPVRVLEIGVGGYSTTTFGGGSLRMWRRFFPRGLVYGLDIFDKTVADQPRVKTLIGDQNDAEYLADMAATYGPFDVIIDDGSHVNEHVRTSFRALFPHLRAGGVYAIEDLWTAYCAGYGGEESPTAAPHTSIGLIKSLVDAIHYEEHPGDAATTPTHEQANLAGIHVYHNIAFVEKGTNAEGSIPAWIPRTIHPSLRTPDSASN
jgi:MycE methyltransferase N-terminal